MFTDLFFVSVLIIGSITAVYTDFKRREVPDWINYFLIIIGLVGHGIVSLIQNSPKPLVYSALAAFSFFILANLMYYSGSWGGGDAKFLVALGALLPIYPETLLKVLNPSIANWPFLVTLFFNTILFGAILGGIYTVYKGLKNKEKIRKEIKKILSKKSMIIIRSILPISSIFILLAFLFFSDYLAFAVFLWTISVILFYSIILSMAVEKISMLKRISPSVLTEGDWIAETIKIDGKIIYKKRQTGIEEKEIEILKRLETEGKLKDVLIKEGLPFLPAFLGGIIFSIIFGDILFKILSIIIV